ncbi:unnamed protein product [Rotaria sp. Silwood2]|nr:unnamed protein product [Rotaria sp. Silwood2]CAF3334700.1 unnamed protein product [Rotaria sp. Silwood2]CAF4059312.1 unnamed protein product [Rotaria sp. Silwood2]CAF4365846.1 unnamed protein product [Rotaria sp. Silwood2]CAF4390068.1 unnamed protein product [Rotaria sp. Silwood2]
MGNQNNIHIRHNKKILRQSQKNQVSQFYIACRNGDIETVKQILSTTPYEQINQLEPNGSTGLHAASFYGHTDIVRLLLLEYGCERHRLNSYGLTAYEEATTQEIRRLFYRASHMNRFHDEHNTFRNAFAIVSSSNEILADNYENSEKINKYIQRFVTKEEIDKERIELSQSQKLLQTRFGRYIIRKVLKYQGFDDDRLNKYITDKAFRIQAIQKLIDEKVTPIHLDYKKCSQLLSNYAQYENIDDLLKLYTLETPFYYQLRDDFLPFFWPLILEKNLKYRRFQGVSYRGVTMTNDDLECYRLAWNNPESIIETLTLSSTSLDRSIAEEFAESQSTTSPNKIRTLMIFNFPRACDQALYLGKIPKYNLPCASEYEDEQEILIVPFTTFHVENIQINSDEHHTTVITLKNIPLEKLSLSAASKLLLKEGTQDYSYLLQKVGF